MKAYRFCVYNYIKLYKQFKCHDPMGRNFKLYYFLFYYKIKIYFQEFFSFLSQKLWLNSYCILLPNKNSMILN